MTRLMLVKGWKGNRRVAVELDVTRRHLAEGINARTVGRHMFYGAWYGRDLKSTRTYGKIQGRVGMPIGKLSGRPSPYLLRKLGASTARHWIDKARQAAPIVPGFAPLKDLLLELETDIRHARASGADANTV